MKRSRTDPASQSQASQSEISEGEEAVDATKLAEVLKVMQQDQLAKSEKSHRKAVDTAKRKITRSEANLRGAIHEEQEKIVELLQSHAIALQSLEEEVGKSGRGVWKSLAMLGNIMADWSKAANDACHEDVEGHAQLELVGEDLAQAKETRLDPLFQ